jgi:hypothetical protein
MSGGDLIVVQLDRARQALIQARNAQEAKKVVDAAHAVEIYAQRQKLSDDAISYAREIKFEALALLGDFLNETPKNEGTLKRGPVVVRDDRGENGQIQRLTDLGITKDLSSNAQFLADIRTSAPETFANIRAGRTSVKQARKALVRLGKVNSNGHRPAAQATSDKLADHFGRVVPEEMIAEWQRAEQVGKHLRGLALEIKQTVAAGFAGVRQQQMRDLIFTEVTNAIISDAENLSYALGTIIPFAVCPTCQGHERKNCLLCKHRGWISKYLFNSPAVSERTRKVIEGRGK